MIGDQGTGKTVSMYLLDGALRRAEGASWSAAYSWNDFNTSILKKNKRCTEYIEYKDEDGKRNEPKEDVYSRRFGTYRAKT